MGMCLTSRNAHGDGGARLQAQTFRHVTDELKARGVALPAPPAG